MILTQISPPHILLPAPVAIQQALWMAQPRALGLLDVKAGEGVVAEACCDPARVTRCADGGMVILEFGVGGAAVCQLGEKGLA